MSKESSHAQQLKIGQYIASLRKQQNLTQAQFANLLKTSQSAVVRMEKGQQNFSTEMLGKISEALGKDIITLSEGVTHYQVDGGHTLSGTVRVKTSHNGAIAVLYASLLNTAPTLLREVPKIEEVYRILEIFSSMGVTISWKRNDLELTPPQILDIKKINLHALTYTRSAILLLGALGRKYPRFSLPIPKKIQRAEQSLIAHTSALADLGIVLTQTPETLDVTRTVRPKSEIVLYEASDLATENALLASSQIAATTTLKYTSANYQVQELCFFLIALGVEIEGIGTSTLTVRGKESLHKKISYAPSEDPIEAMLFLSAAIVTRSMITLERCPIDFLELELLKLEKMGFKYEITRRYRATNGHTSLVDIKTHPSRLVALKDKIHPLPYPGINIDNLPFFVPIATQAQGRTLIHDWPNENRAVHYLELNKLGANIVFADQHRVFVEGPNELKAAEIIAPPALRPAAVILIAMLAAKGTSTLRNVYSINRGYENICPRLNSLGARIKILHEI